jgi:hypothetical protein
MVVVLCLLIGHRWRQAGLGVWCSRCGKVVR